MAPTAYTLRPWTDVVRPHPDVTSGDLAMGTYAANLARVAYRGESAADVYEDPRAFFAATYFTETMRGLLADVFGALAGQGGDRVLQLRTPFGGGKTHTLLALYHLSTARSAAKSVPELAEVPDPGTVHVAVLSGEYLDPQRGREVEGRRIRTLWGELAYQLGGWPAYDRLMVDGEEGVPPGGEQLGELLAGGPALVLLDEVLIYVVKGRALRREDTNVGQQTMLFLHNLTEAVNQEPRAAMVYSLQASVGEAVQEEGLLRALEHIAARVDQRREPVSGDEVLRVVQRRLFESVGDTEVRGEVARAYGGLLREQLEATAESDDARREAARTASNLERRIEESYPFHPELIDLMYQRWGTLPSYQRTRGALQFLATTVHALWAARSGREPQALIGPGDVDLADEQARASLFEQVGEATQYTSVVEADFLAADAGTRLVDERLGRDVPALERLRVGTRVGTAIMLLSFGAREGDDRGALEQDVIAAALVPGLDGNVLRTALADLRGEALLYLHHTGRRYRFEPRPNLNKLIVNEQEKFSSEEVLGLLRSQLEAALGVPATGEATIWPPDSARIRDGVRGFQLAYLPPDWSEANQPLSSLASQAGSAPRRFKNAVAFVLPHAQSFDLARGAARTSLAVGNLLSQSVKHNFSPEQKGELRERLKGADRRLASLLGQSYARVALPVAAGDGGVARLESRDLGTVLAAGRSLHERVREALQHDVFDLVTGTRVLAIARVLERGSVPCERLVDDFFSYFELPKVWSTAAVQTGIADGVTKGLFAYAVGVRGEGVDVRVENSRLIQLGVPLDANEVDLGPGAALLSLEVAERLREPEPPSPPGPGDEGPPSVSGKDPIGGIDDPAVGPRLPGVSHHGRVRMNISATAADLTPLDRALRGLRDVVGHDGEIRITVDVDASRVDGAIDQTQFQNRVRQHLEEDEMHFEERWD